MVLHLVPYQKIPAQFERIAEQIDCYRLAPAIPQRVREIGHLHILHAETMDQQQLLVLWPLECLLPVHYITNDDTEKWHFLINSKANINGMNLFDLVPLLWEEADDIPMERELLCREMGTRYQRREDRDLQSSSLLFLCWYQRIKKKLKNRGQYWPETSYGLAWKLMGAGLKTYRAWKLPIEKDRKAYGSAFGLNVLKLAWKLYNSQFLGHGLNVLGLKTWPERLETGFFLSICDANEFRFI